MGIASATSSDQLTQLARQFPDWRIWKSDAGHFYATRFLRHAEAVTGMPTMLDAEYPAALLAKLCAEKARVRPAAAPPAADG